LCWPGLSWSEPKTTVSMSVSGHKKKVSGCKTNKQLQEIRLAPLHSHTQDPQDLEDPQAPLDPLASQATRELVENPATTDLRAPADPVDSLDPPDPLDVREMREFPENLEPKAPLDQLERWDDPEFQECLDQKVTGVSPDVLEKMVSVESRDSRER